MEIVRLKKIIGYSEKHGNEIKALARDFYARIGMDGATEFRNVIQIIRSLFVDENFIIIELPFADKEIGALCYKGDAVGYAFLNTSLPKVNVNFALCHELYHLLYQKTEFKKQIELYMNEHYYEHEEEFAANLFASMLLMPEQKYCFMYNKFLSETGEDEGYLPVLAKLMSYFEVPYMAALIRCYELKLLDSGKLLESLLCVKHEEVLEVFDRLWLDESILQATKKDDFDKFELFVKYYGEKYYEEGFLSDRMVGKALQNMRMLYEKIKGE